MRRRIGVGYVSSNPIRREYDILINYWVGPLCLFWGCDWGANSYLLIEATASSLFAGCFSSLFDESCYPNILDFRREKF